MTVDETRRKAQAAESVLNNAVFNDVFEELRSTYMTRWEASPEEDTKSRELLYNRLKALHEVKRELIRAINAIRLIDRG